MESQALNPASILAPSQPYSSTILLIKANHQFRCESAYLWPPKLITPKRASSHVIQLGCQCLFVWYKCSVSNKNDQPRKHSVTNITTPRDARHG